MATEETRRGRAARGPATCLDGESAPDAGTGPDGAPAAAQGRTRRRRFGIMALGVGGVVLGGGPAAFVALQPVQVLPRLGLAPGYGFVDQRGGRVTSDDMRGGVTLYAFVHGGCGAACEEVETRMREVHARLSEVEPASVPVRLVTVSLDPDRDDPTELARRAAPGADPETWRFATADTAHLRTVVGEGFDAWHVRESDGSLTYDPSLVLVDPMGIKRARFRYQIPGTGTLLAHISGIAREARATGAAHLAYEAAHLFACYTPY